MSNLLYTKDEWDSSMQPNDQRNQTPYVPPRDDAARTRIPERNQSASQEAAADIVRSQIDTILEHHDPIGDGGMVQQSPQPQPVAEQSTQQESQSSFDAQSEPAQQQQQPAPNPYHHTHTTNETINKEDSAQWQKYHSAWQRYYQEYYSRYYVGELYKTQTEFASRQARVAERSRQEQSPNDGTMSQTEAIGDLRSQLRAQITTGAKKVRKSRHFIPISAAAVVMLVFVFLQFNSIIFAAVYAYKSPGNISPVNVLTNPSTNLSVDKAPLLIVPKLNIDVPVDYNAAPDYDSQMAAMKDGTAYFGVPGANAKPGQVGNFGIAGHSSNQLFDSGTHKFIFVNLDLMNTGDLIYLNYNGTRYTYSVVEKKVVDPTDVSALINHTTKPEVTLITCTPSGTALHRLLVFAEQISPAPSGAKKAPKSTNDTSNQNITMAGNSPTLLERIFGGGH